MAEAAAVVDRRVVSASQDVPALLVRIAREQETRLIEILRNAIVHARRKFGLPVPSYSDEEFRQIARGYFAVLEEALSSSGTLRREAYMESIIEGMAKAGIRYPYLVHVSVGFQVGVIAEWVSFVPEEHRAAATDWLMVFFADYDADMILAGIRLAEREALDPSP